MTSAYAQDNLVKLVLSKAEALVLFEWLSRNWEATKWEVDGLFSDPSEKQLLIWMKNDLGSILSGIFNSEYKELIKSSCEEINRSVNGHNEVNQILLEKKRQGLGGSEIQEAEEGFGGCVGMI